MTSVYVIHSRSLDNSKFNVLDTAYPSPAMAAHVLRALQAECSDKSYSIFTLDLLESPSGLYQNERSE